MPDVTPAPIGTDIPAFEWVDPKTLHVEESYQRKIPDKSRKLIRHIVASWHWAQMKPPICVRDEKKRLLVIDGQHTAMAAASHKGIKEIPVMIVAGKT